LINLPLNRDEAAWAYAAQVLFKGIPLYDGMFDTKLPGVVLIDALCMAVFGQDAWQIRLAAFITVACSAFLIYKIIRLKFNRNESLICASVFILQTTGLSTPEVFRNDNEGKFGCSDSGT
jgi:hypothetical protein